MEIEGQGTEDAEELNKIVSVQSEASIIEKASEEIKKLIQANSESEKLATKAIVEDKPENLLEKNDEPASESNILRARLQNQVRTGELTPFQAVAKENKKQTSGKSFKEQTQLLDFEKYLLSQAELAKQKRLKRNKDSKNEKEKEAVDAKKMKIQEEKDQQEKKPEAKALKKHSKKAETVTSQSKKSRNSVPCQPNSFNNAEAEESENHIMYLEGSETSNTLMFEQIAKVRNTFGLNEDCDESGSEYVPSDEYDSEEETVKKSQRKKKHVINECSSRRKRVLDDGDEDIYKQRVRNSGFKKNEILHKVDNLFRVPVRIWKHLYKYQRVAVRWLWELHTRNLGGLLGDEMGLGKTVQIIAYLAGLDCSDLLSDGGRFRGLGPTLIVCPATLLEQWVSHFHEWCPTMRVVMLHQSGTFQGDVDELLHSIKPGGILVTSYSGILIHKEPLVRFQWHYVILDEGHKIRNPDAKVSKVVKTFLTPHRLLLTGCPMQNSLKELWSLFDFILPGKLGTLPAFMEHCAGPITRGGYANATRLQEATALQVATMLKNAITPYMLRRTKYDVQHHISLPEKNEQVLFCSLTEEQRQLYRQFLRSDDVSCIIHERREGNRYRARLLVALTALRKICNHPDLFLYSEHQAVSDEEEEPELEVDENEVEKFGYWKRSGKMTVVRSLLKIWKKQGHRVLVFTQSRQMMHVLEGLVQKEKYNYLRMDGTTPMGQRQSTISRFNRDESYFVFLLTTRVGGLGVNLTGANRVIIYDPDWNPATDAQARERAWRIGQEKNVTIYRLITAGTVEEKMYHRQVFKILLSNKVLEDPRQRRLFRTTDLTELFNLNEPIPGGNSESDQLFHKSKLSPNQPNFTLSKIEAMRKLASTLSKRIGEKAADNETSNEKDNNDTSTDLKSAESESVNGKSLDINDLNENDVSNNSDNSNCVNNKELDSSENRSFSIEEGGKNVENVKCEEPMEIDSDKLADKSIVEDKGNDCIREEGTNFENEKCEDPMEIDSDKLVDKSIVEDKVNDCMIKEGEICEEESKDSTKLKSVDTDVSNNCIKNKKEEKNKKTHRKHKKSKKSKSEEISAIFEGERVSCLIGRRLGNSKEREPMSTAEDQYVLKKLFSKAAVSSAFQHESVLANAVLNSEDETPLQRSAKETASEKMEIIRQSRKWCWKPCWDNPPEELEDSD